MPTYCQQNKKQTVEKQNAEFYLPVATFKIRLISNRSQQHEAINFIMKLPKLMFPIIVKFRF